MTRIIQCGNCKSIMDIDRGACPLCGWVWTEEFQNDLFARRQVEHKFKIEETRRRESLTNFDAAWDHSEFLHWWSENRLAIILGLWLAVVSSLLVITSAGWIDSNLSVGMADLLRTFARFAMAGVLIGVGVLGKALALGSKFEPVGNIVLVLAFFGTYGWFLMSPLWLP